MGIAPILVSRQRVSSGVLGGPETYICDTNINSFFYISTTPGFGYFCLIDMITQGLTFIKGILYVYILKEAVYIDLNIIIPSGGAKLVIGAQKRSSRNRAP
jgi:hypothetical protein